MTKLPEHIIIPPGVDLHDHFRQPSPINTAETFESGTLSALLGGYIVTDDMPNTPGRETWSFALEIEKQRFIRDQAYVHVGTYAGSQPESNNENQLGPMSSISVGIKFYLGKTTGYNRDLSINDVMPAVQEWHRVAPNSPIMIHRGNADLNEIISVIAKGLGHRLHICHVNSPAEVRIVSRAKRQGLPVTCGVCPHHLFMTSHDVMTKGSLAEMQPPLAHQADAEELWRMLVRGEIDVIETDHAPHPIENKMRAEQSKDSHDPITCYGVPGILETIPQLLNQVRLGKLSLERLVEITSTKPAEILGVKLSDQTLATWSNELFQIDGQPELGRTYASPYIGNLAVGKIISLKSRGKELITDTGIQRVSHPVLLRSQLV